MGVLYVVFLIFAAFVSGKDCLALPGAKLSIETLGLTPALRKHAEVFHGVVDDKLRYQQLLHLATTCPPMKSKLKVQENKVPGCLSTVFVHAERKKDGRITFVADADSQMAKGLVTMLVQGLTDNYPSDIEKVDPAFIDYAGIGSSLTSGRNNGFLNMLALMKHQARKLVVELPPLKEKRTRAKREPESPPKSGTAARGCADSTPGSVEAARPEETTADGESNPMRDSIIAKLQTLQPSTLSVENVSAQHRNHPGTATLASRETNFNVFIVAACFEGLGLVNRHKMVYSLLQDELANGLHALSIVAKTVGEV